MTKEPIDRINNAICFGFGCVICTGAMLGALGIDLNVSSDTKQSCELHKNSSGPCLAR